MLLSCALRRDRLRSSAQQTFRLSPVPVAPLRSQQRGHLSGDGEGTMNRRRRAWTDVQEARLVSIRTFLLLNAWSGLLLYAAVRGWLMH
jgi:hypothetical protein